MLAIFMSWKCIWGKNYAVWDNLDNPRTPSSTTGSILTVHTTRALRTTLPSVYAHCSYSAHTCRHYVQPHLDVYALAHRIRTPLLPTVSTQLSPTRTFPSIFIHAFPLIGSTWASTPLRTPIAWTRTTLHTWQAPRSDRTPPSQTQFKSPAAPIYCQPLLHTKPSISTAHQPEVSWSKRKILTSQPWDHRSPFYKLHLYLTHINFVYQHTTHMYTLQCMQFNCDTLYICSLKLTVPHQLT
jgi:hypothetical protein